VFPDRRQGHSRCGALAPKIIDADDRGFARIKGAGFVLAALREKARLAVKNCPEFALRLVAEERKTS
jgi:ferredoxin